MRRRRGRRRRLGGCEREREERTGGEKDSNGSGLL